MKEEFLEDQRGPAEWSCVEIDKGNAVQRLITFEPLVHAYVHFRVSKSVPIYILLPSIRLVLQISGKKIVASRNF